jgi:hypothetical protein
MCERWFPALIESVTSRGPKVIPVRVNFSDEYFYSTPIDTRESRDSGFGFLKRGVSRMDRQYVHKNIRKRGAKTRQWGCRHR